MARQLQGGLRELLTTTQRHPQKHTVRCYALSCNHVSHYPALAGPTSYCSNHYTKSVALPRSQSNMTHTLSDCIRKKTFSVHTHTHTIGHKLEFSYLGSSQAICLAPTKTP